MPFFYFFRLPHQRRTPFSFHRHVYFSPHRAKIHQEKTEKIMRKIPGKYVFALDNVTMLCYNMRSNNVTEHCYVQNAIGKERRDNCQMTIL
nr:MAG TPA: hypothetical protein [Caudoviricetes sp.]